MTRTDADDRITRIDLAEPAAYLPPSRAATLDAALAALGQGPILVTGDAGVGKTWLADRLMGRARANRWVAVDLTPTEGPADFYRQVARGLGLEVGSTARADIADALAERSADGHRHALLIDEAQNLSAGVWEEARVLANRLGRDDGFADLILVGQTALVRRFATRALASFEARLAAHVHLRPFDLDEANAWLDRRHPGLGWSADEREAFHRDSGGNPARMIRRTARLAARPVALAVAAPMMEFEPAAPAAVSAPTALDAPAPAAMIARPMAAPPANRPPLHVEDNAIEVGWSTDEDAPDPVAEDEDDAAGGTAPRQEPSDQAVHDHYAALQAWREWASNQEKRHQPARTDRDIADEIDEAAAAEAAEAAAPARLDRETVRAEGQQPFAPFGQLFPRVNAAREADRPRS